MNHFKMNQQGFNPCQRFSDTVERNHHRTNTDGIGHSMEMPVEYGVTILPEGMDVFDLQAPEIA
jgi:hypothetical protein